MKKILVLVQGLNGCSLHRLILPYRELQRIIKSEDNIEIKVGLGSVKDEDELVEKILEYDILIFHNSLPGNTLDRIKDKIITICDIDDSLHLPLSHPLYQTYVTYNIVKILTYIACSILLVLMSIGVFKTKKISDKFCGIFFMVILLMRLFAIRQELVYGKII